MSAFKNIKFPSLFRQWYKDLREFDRDLLAKLDEQESSLEGILERGISFDDNCDVRRITFTSSATPDAENEVAHTLGKVPNGYMITNINKAAVVYADGTAWTTSKIYLKSNVASVTIKIMVF